MVELEKSEGVYGYIGGHIYFDCKCGSNKCHYAEPEERGDEEIEDAIKRSANNMIINYKSTYGNCDDVRHTFYTGKAAFEMVLDDLGYFIDEGMFKGKGLALICEGCGNNFVFTPKLVKELTA